MEGLQRGQDLSLSTSWGWLWHGAGLWHSIQARVVWCCYACKQGTSSCSWYTSRALICPSVHLQPAFYMPDPRVSPSRSLGFPIPSLP